MTKQLDEPWGRFDLDFPNDERFLAMPVEEEIRGKAYLLLLAMGGRSVIDRTDGVISEAVFADLAQRLWPETAPGLLWKALAARGVRMIQRQGRSLVLTRQSKWQRTREEILAAIESGRRGASKRWGSRRGPNRGGDGGPHLGDPIAEQSKKKSRAESVSNVPKGTRPAEPDPGALVLTSPVSRTPAEQVFDAWVDSTSRTGRTVFDGKRQRVVAAALKAYPLEDVLDAVRGWRHSAHHRGENDTRTVYNDLELLLRDGKQIEKFRNLERQAPSALAVGKQHPLDRWASDLLGGGRGQE